MYLIKFCHYLLPLMYNTKEDILKKFVIKQQRHIFIQMYNKIHL